MSPNNDQGKERRHWRAFWDEFPGWLRTGIVIALTGSASIGGMTVLGKDDKGKRGDDFMTEDEFRAVVRTEIGPMKAGFKAFVATQPERVQLAVLKAWNREEEKLKEAK